MFDGFLDHATKGKGPNRFWPVNQKEIATAESRIGLEFPTELRSFFTAVGSGFWAQGVADKKWDRSLVNRIPSPSQIADLLLDDENPWAPKEGFTEDAIPFFDVGENTYLLVLTQSESSCRVTWPDGKAIVAQSIREFFDKLYDHARFYLDVEEL